MPRGGAHQTLERETDEGSEGLVDLRLACRRLVRVRFNTRANADLGVSAVHLGGRQIRTPSSQDRSLRWVGGFGV